MSEESLLGGGEEAPVEGQEQQSVAPKSEAPSLERPEWLLDKYATEDRTIEEAMAEQAKAYNEAQKMLGSFTGAPDEDYALQLPDGMDGEIDTELPQYQAFTEWAKSNNLSEQGAQDLFNIFVSYQQDIGSQFETDFTEQRNLLGPQADQRITQVNTWLQNNLSESEMEAVQSMTYRADQIEVLEKLISKTRNSKLPSSQDAPPAENGYSWDDFHAAVGDPRWKTDTRFRDNHRRKAQALGAE